MPWMRRPWPGFIDGRHCANETPDLAHEVAHFLVAPKRRRKIANFGLGDPSARPYTPAPRVSYDTSDCEEEMASLLGIMILLDAGAPRLARRTYLAHNWGRDIDIIDRVTTALGRVARLPLPLIGRTEATIRAWAHRDAAKAARDRRP